MEDRVIRTLGINLFTFSFSVQAIKKILEIEDSEAKTELNAIVIMALHAFSEGALTQILKEKLENSEGYKRARNNHDLVTFNFIYEKIVNNPRNLEELKTRFKLIGIELSKIKKWKSMIALSQLRNMVAHGASFSYNVASIDDIDNSQGESQVIKKSEIHDEWSAKFLSYLEETNFIDKNFRSQPLSFQRIHKTYSTKIFSSDVIKHFIKCCNTFFNDLLSNEPEGIKESTQRAIRSLQKIT
ncbi:hypothetical protein [Ekhidna sp.]|uniref:hypothetical protein n=1 Tax=Ekhidna sp. TaxID=2608089 RepID=UPI0032EE705C